MILRRFRSCSKIGILSKEHAKKLKDAGYLTTASVNDTYRVFSNNVTSKWVENRRST